MAKVSRRDAVKDNALETTKQIARRIKEAREARGLTQAELAPLIGISAGAVAQWELGISCPNVDRITGAAEALGVAPEWIAFGAGQGLDANKSLAYFKQGAAAVTERRSAKKDRNIPVEFDMEMLLDVPIHVLKKSQKNRRVPVFSKVDQIIDYTRLRRDGPSFIKREFQLQHAYTNFDVGDEPLGIEIFDRSNEPRLRRGDVAFFRRAGFGEFQPEEVTIVVEHHRVWIRKLTMAGNALAFKAFNDVWGTEVISEDRLNGALYLGKLAGFSRPTPDSTLL